MSYYLFEQEGKSRSDAEARALETLGVDAADVEFEELTVSRGLMRLVKREPVVLRVRPVNDLEAEVHAKGVLMTVINKLGIDANILQVGERDDNLYVEIGSEDSGFLIGKHGRTLDAIQFLVNLIVNTRTRSGRRIMVDVEQYRERRERSLKRLASRMAERVAKSGRPILLNYMNPYERRIIHLALEEDSRVYTESDGNGVYKRVRVIPTERKKGGGGRRNSGDGRGRDENRIPEERMPDAEPARDRYTGNDEPVDLQEDDPLHPDYDPSKAPEFDEEGEVNGNR
ncbi:MAG: KH domain-containing protein [bacterium]|nr:KH domain-containing protein [bacterium]